MTLIILHINRLFYACMCNVQQLTSDHVNTQVCHINIDTYSFVMPLLHGLLCCLLRISAHSRLRACNAITPGK